MKILENTSFKNLLLFFLYLSLLLGLYLNEDTMGGALNDFTRISIVIKNFALNYDLTIENYRSFKIAHYPYFYIFLSKIYNIFQSFFLGKLVIVHISLFLPFFFYQAIKINFKNYKYIFFIPLVIFFSPYYRTTAIWGLNDNIALIFFTLSILFYLKSLNSNKKNVLTYILLNSFFLMASVYTRQYYAVFVIFFIYKFYLNFNLKTFSFYIFFNTLFSLILIKNVFFNNETNYAFKFLTDNYINNLVILISIFFTYLIPLYLNKANLKNFYIYYKNKKFLILLNIVLAYLMLSFFNYDIPYGGGILFTLFYNETFIYLFYLIFIIAIFSINHFVKDNLINNLIVLSCILLLPMGNIYQKYLDPLCIILIFTLFKNSIIDNFIINLKDNLKFFYSYFILIYIGAVYYYYF